LTLRHSEKSLRKSKSFVLHKVTTFLSCLGCILCLLLAVSDTAHAQHQKISYEIKSSADSQITLGHPFILWNTLVLNLDSTLLLTPGRDFSLDSLRSSIVLKQELLQLLFPNDQTRRHTLYVTYDYLPINLKRSYARNRVTISEVLDSLGQKDSTARRRLEATVEEPSDAERMLRFQKSGSISRGFELGNNRDLSLTSGFNLQFSGELLEDVTVTGALNEEATPIQPEGNTQTLQEIDKIYIEIKAGEHFKSTFGDFFLDLGSQKSAAKQFELGSFQPSKVETPLNAYTNISRKLLGVQAEASFPFGSALVSAAATKGKYNTLTFNGQEAVQGPYRLTGKNGERTILIIAGTERVYVDGILQTRGERNDYVIDYGLGEVTFQPRRLITNNSRITIDFEYTDQQYSRSLVTSRVTANVIPDALKVSATYLREGDNQDAPLSLTLSEADKETLREAGNDASKATKSGVQLIARDSLGRAKGSYYAIDTVINGNTERAYIYAPNDTVRSLYTVTFGLRGAGKGSYQRQGIGQFAFVGSGRGDYDTLINLPLPVLNQLLELSAATTPLHSINLFGSLATSAFSPNRFADQTQTGLAYKTGITIDDSLSFSKSLPFKYSITGLLERIESEFTPADRVNEVELYRSYGYESTGNDLLTPSLTRRVAQASISPIANITVTGEYSTLARPELSFSSTKNSARLVTTETSSLPYSNLLAEYIPTEDSLHQQQATWNRYLAEIGKAIGTDIKLTPSLKLRSETKKITPFGSATLDSLISNSFRFNQYGGGLSAAFGSQLTINTSLSFDREDSVLSNNLTQFSRARTLHVEGSLLNVGGFSTLADFTLRDKEYIDSAARVRAGGNKQTLLLRVEPKYATASRGFSVSGLYAISNQRTARLERQFFAVPAGYGNYRYLGDLNGNSKQDPDEFQLARYADEGTYILLNLPTEQLFPTSDLRSYLQAQLTPSGLFSPTDTSWLRSFLEPISFETALRIEETSTTENANDIFFFKLSQFQNDSTTLKGLMEWDQYINLNELNPTHSYRLRFLQRKSAIQFNTGLERLTYIERSIRMRFRPFSELLTENTVSSITDIAHVGEGSVNRPHETAITSLLSEWSYHPQDSRFDYGLKLEGALAKEHAFLPTATSFYNGEALRAAYAFISKARIRAEIERNELLFRDINLSTLSLPYSFTGGRTQGITWLWKLALDYNIGSGVVATITYDGRNVQNAFGDTPGERQTIHNARGEIRASF